MLLFLKDFTKRVADLAVNRRSCPSDNKKVVDVFRAVEYLCTEVSRTSERIDALESKLAGVRVSQQEFKKNWEDLRTCLESGSPTMLELPTAMSQNHQLNFNDLQRQCEQTANSIQLLCEKLNQVKLSVYTRMVDLESIVEEHGRKLLDHSSAITKQDSQLQMSYDGCLTWKITKVRSWLLENEPLDGPIFYTGRYGYKMSVKLTQRLCQSGLEKSVSLSFVIMKGEYDSLLRWPFQQKITMMVIDQDKETSQHLLHIIYPDSSAPFLRPISNKNVAAEVFSSLWPESKLLNHPGYIVEDTMFIKIIVDTSNL